MVFSQDYVAAEGFHFGALYYGVTVAKMQRYGLDI